MKGDISIRESGGHYYPCSTQSSIGWRVFYVYSIIEDLMRHHRQAEAAEVFRALATWYESKGSSVTEDHRKSMAASLVSMKMDDAAMQHYRKLIEYYPKSYFVSDYTAQMAIILARKRDSTAARKLMESISKEHQQYPDYSYWQARIAAELRQRELAVRLLRKSFDGGRPRISLSHSRWFDFPTLQGFPPFDALVASDR